MNKKNGTLTLLHDLIDKAAKAGADGADAVFVERVSLSLTQRLGEMEHLERSEGADLGLRAHPNYAINIEANERGLVHMGLAITTLVKPNLRDLFEMHARARGELTEDEAAAEVVFGPDSAFDVEKIMAEFL